MAKGKYKQFQMYEVDYKSGKINRKSTFCPRCKGIFLAQHKDRKSCGNCGYTEYISTKKSKKK
jgi:small subunit ribosomal protein S27Ae